MTDDLDRAIHTLMSDVRELSPDAPPFPGAHQPLAERSRLARVPGWGIAVAAALLVITIVGLPLLIAGGSETPASAPGTTVPDSTPVTSTTAASPDTVASVVGTWTITSVTVSGSTTTIDAAAIIDAGHQPPQVTVSDTRIEGFTGCNNFSRSPIAVAAGSLSIGDFGTFTAAVCPEDRVDLIATEDAILAMLFQGEVQIDLDVSDEAMTWSARDIEISFNLETRPAGNGQTTIQYPADGMVVIDPQVTIMGTVPADASLTVGGLPVTPIAGGATDSAGNQIAYFEASVILEPGDNTIELVASTEDVSTQTLHVRYLPDATEQLAFITRTSTTEIEVDYAEWLTGEEANEAARLDGAIPPGEQVPNDFYIRNTNPQVRTLSLASDVVVILNTAATGGVSEIPVSHDDWLSLFKSDGTPWDPEIESVPDYPEPHFGFFGAGSVYAPYWLTIDNGVVVQIRQQYVP